jgi:hypothetical protein
MANSAPTGNITISGTPQVGKTLTAIDTLADADGMGTLSYIWTYNDDGGYHYFDVPNATQSTYTLTASDVGKKFWVKGIYTDLKGNREWMMSGPTREVFPVVDDHPPTGAVTINGTAEEGQTLNVTNTLADADDLAALSYQWLSNGVVISGATKSTYTLTSADVGKTIGVRVDFVDGLNNAYNLNPYFSSPTIPKQQATNHEPTGNITISGTPQVGQTLTAIDTLSDADELNKFSYQWLLDGVAIENTDQATYQLKDADLGKKISVAVFYLDGADFDEYVESSQMQVPLQQTANHAPTGNVIITGVAALGQTLTASNSLADVDGLGAISYQWLSGGNVISGATKSTYVLTASDVGKALSVKASYTDLKGTAESVTSSITALVIGSSQSSITPTASIKTLLSNSIFTVSDNNINVIGGTAGNEIAKISSSATNTTFNANIERIELSGSVSTYKFIAISGVGVEIWDTSSKIATIPSLNQDMKIAFSNGTGILKQIGASDFQLGNAAISSGTATTPGNVVIDTTDLPGSQNALTSTGSIKTLLSNGVFTVSDNNMNVVGGTGGNEIVRVQAGITNVTLNANIERLELSNTLFNYKFIIISGVGVEIWDTSSKIATIPSLNQDMKIAFTNGTGILKQIGASDFQLGNAAISSGTATTPSNVVIDTTDLSTVGTSTNLTGSTTISATNLIGTGTAGVDTFNIAGGTYNATINGFAAGDKLSFFAGAAISITPDTNQSDGIQQLTATNAATEATTTITLTGLTATQDLNVFNVNSFNSVFGAGSIL